MGLIVVDFLLILLLEFGTDTLEVVVSYIALVMIQVTVTVLFFMKRQMALIQRSKLVKNGDSTSAGTTFADVASRVIAVPGYA